MKKKYERYGLMAEIAGMGILLLATFWDSGASGWWDNSAREMQYLIQEKANIAILESTQQLIFAEMKTTDEHARTDTLINASQKIGIEIRELIEKRNERTNALKGQAALFADIKLALLAIGSLFLIFGKGLTLFSLLQKRDEDTKGNDARAA